MSAQTQVFPPATVVTAESSEFVKALGLTSATTIVMCSGSYGQLLDLTMFAVIIFSLTISGLFVLRFRRPGAERLYRAFGYPILPAAYILMALFIEIVLLRYKPQYIWPGLIIALLGIPVYLFWSRSVRSSATELQGEAS